MITLLAGAVLICLQPKFLSKEERAKVAIAKRAAEIRQTKEREENARKERDALEAQIKAKDREQRMPPSRRMSTKPAIDD